MPPHTGYTSLSTEDSDDIDAASTLAPSIKSTKSSISPKPTLPIYYGEGPFDPPSSDSGSEEEEEELLTKAPGSPSYAELGHPNGKPNQRQRPNGIRYLLTSIISLILLSCLIGIIAAHTYSGSNTYLRNSNKGFKKITMDALWNGTFYAPRVSVEWVAEAGDGVFSVEKGSKILLIDLKSNTTKDLVDRKDIKDEQGNMVLFNNGDWSLSPDGEWLLQWRHSSFGNYYIHSLTTHTTHPITPPTHPPTTSYASWSPSSQAASLVFIQSNDLYYLPSALPNTSPIRITQTGNATRFNGVPDWVYEEEVFSSDFAVWWAPGGDKVVYLEFDETDVPEFTFPIYNPTNDAHTVNPYTSSVTMRYPKPGYPNPIVNVHLVGLPTSPTSTEFTDVELGWQDRKPRNDSVIMEVAWVNENELIVKEVNRNADDGRVVYFDFSSRNGVQEVQGKVTRKLGKDGEEGDEGWIESNQNIHPIPSLNAYLDVLPTKQGFNHIALFSPPDSGEPKWITQGEWEVVGGVKGVDEEKGLVYFESTKQSSVERHLYSASLSTSPQEPTWITKSYVSGTGTESILQDGEVIEQGYFSTDFSPQAGFHVLSYLGPGVPWQKVLSTNDSDWEYILNMNEALANVTREYESPTVVHGSITIDGYDLNTIEFRPPSPKFDDSGRTKYAVLFHVYGGPASQTVDTIWRRGWDDYLVCELGYVVVVVDGRGTGYKGRKLRNPVKGNLGFWEGRDQVEAAR
ncbi:putative dipeptidyl aminopeptidase [Moniliophthora roreri]|uniref:Putative dipeptidyl-peptidase and tripeptidyl-peptidase n=1 Tax=Moniliophthora roreri TaxID=221103 RepID=A0A0W0G954_MONRR|nr:putative dipeptidyl aminopeptidase [Moniliophthora roreri]